jgi:hypothetical protein
MFEEEDMALLKKMKRMTSKKKKSFSTVINSKDLTEEDLDKLFLSY